MQYTSINDAARDVINRMVESENLDPSDFPYSSDVTVSLNQIVNILSPSIEPASSIADAFANLMDVAVFNGSGER